MKSDMKSGKPLGRPRSFDRDAALERAMRVFWRQGYDATSVSDLTHAMGINPPSLYAAFGDKERLYLAAVERYHRSRVELAEKWLEEEPTAQAAIGRLLTEAANWFARSGAPRGSMLVLSATTCSAASLQPELAARRASLKAALKARIDRGIRAGELPRGTDSSALAIFYTTVFQGMSIQARDGATGRTLLTIAQTAMDAWPLRRQRGPYNRALPSTRSHSERR